MIEIKDLSYSYTEVNKETTRWALRNINLKIPSGQFLVILGSNGSGKSTLAKHLNGMLIPTEGSCTIDQMSTRDEKEIYHIREKVGMVFQNPDNQIVAAIVEEDVAFGPENLGIPSEEIRKRVDWALEKVGMTKYKMQGPHLLSGGQKQRVAIAGVLAMQPAYIVLDESTAMLDPEGRSEVLAVANQLKKELGISIVLITHHMEEALLADRVVVLNQGSVWLDGHPEEVFFQDQALIEAGLEVPAAILLYKSLFAKGVLLDSNIKMSELVEELWRLKSKN